MNTNQADTEIQRLHQEFRAKRDVFAAKLTAALKASGWTVTSSMSTADWMTGRLAATKPEAHKTFTMYYDFETKGSGWNRRTPSKLVLKVGQQTGYRSGATRYTKLDDKLVTLLTALTNETLQGVIEYEQRSAAAADEKARFEQRRVMELAGYLNPPGTEIKIITGNGPNAGNYHVAFNHDSILNTPLTREQVIKLIDLLNEIQGSTNALIIVSKHKIDGSELAWSATGWWTSQNPYLYATQEQAEAALARAREQSQNPETVQIVRYDSRFTIKPGNPVTTRRY